LRPKTWFIGFLLAGIAGCSSQTALDRNTRQQWTAVAFFCGCHDCQVVSTELAPFREKVTVFFDGNGKDADEFRTKSGNPLPMATDPENIERKRFGIQQCPAVILVRNGEATKKFGDGDPIDLVTLLQEMEEHIGKN